ncbi:MAG: response regulator transcription factor [Gemmobacter sp.]
MMKLGLFDDHPIFLEGLAGVFAGSRDFTVTAKGTSATEAVALSKPGKVDVVLLDLDMPGNAFKAIPAIRQQAPGIRILVFTASSAIEHAVRALEAGAHGYVIKGSTASELAAAIRSVAKGETYVTQSLAAKVISALRNASMRRAALQALSLSLREEQIVRHLLKGKTNREIASHLDISEKTVKHYMTILMQKMNVRNRIEVVLAAQKLAAGAGEPQGGPRLH